MRSQRIHVLLCLAVFLFGAACEHSEKGEKLERGHAMTRTASEHEGVTFSEKNGLHVPPAAANFIDLQTEEVSERTLPRGVTINAQVYSASTNTSTAFASALLETKEAEPFKIGTPIEARTTGGGVLSGRVVERKTHWKQNAGTEVLLAIDDPDHSLALGSSVAARAQNNAAENVVTVPSSALLRTLEGMFVYTVSGNHFVRAAVKTGDTNGEFVEIKDGLYAGDQVVTRPAMTLWLAELQAIRGGKACADGD